MKQNRILCMLGIRTALTVHCVSGTVLSASQACDHSPWGPLSTTIPTSSSYAKGLQLEEFLSFLFSLVSPPPGRVLSTVLCSNFIGESSVWRVEGRLGGVQCYQ